MVLGLEWGEFGVRVCGEFFLAAEFYEEGEVYCGAAGYDCALVCGDGNCKFCLFSLPFFPLLFCVALGMRRL